MDTVLMYRGRRISPAEVAFIGKLITEHPEASAVRYRSSCARRGRGAKLTGCCATACAGVCCWRCIERATSSCRSHGVKLRPGGVLLQWSRSLPCRSRDA